MVPVGGLDGRKSYWGTASRRTRRNRYTEHQREQVGSNGTEMALVVCRGGIVRHGPVTYVRRSDGTDLILHPLGSSVQRFEYSLIRRQLKLRSDQVVSANLHQACTLR